MNRLTEVGRLSVSRKWKKFQEILWGEFEQQQRRVFHKVMNVQSNLRRRSHRSEILKAAAAYTTTREAPPRRGVRWTTSDDPAPVDAHYASYGG